MVIPSDLKDIFVCTYLVHIYAETRGSGSPFPGGGEDEIRRRNLKTKFGPAEIRP